MRGSNCRGMDHGWLVFAAKKIRENDETKISRRADLMNQFVHVLIYLTILNQEGRNLCPCNIQAFKIP